MPYEHHGRGTEGGDGGLVPPVVIPHHHLVLKNSFGFGGTNVSLLFGDVVDIEE
jgi:hypothetical protein